MTRTEYEILNTPEALGRCLHAASSRSGEFSPLLREAGKIIFIGCGSSYYLSKSMARLCQMYMNKPAMALAGGDLLLHAKRYAKCVEGALVVALSRSGSTSEICKALDIIKNMGVSYTLMSFVCVENSPLSKMGGAVLEMPWAYDESVCQTRCVTCLYSAAALAIALSAGEDGLAQSLWDAGEVLEGFINKAEAALAPIAREGWTQAIVLADGEISGAAEEAALAYKEICRVNSNFYNVLDSRHGPMVMINKNSLVVAALNAPASKLETDLLKDVLGRGARLVVYSDIGQDIAGAAVIPFDKALHHGARAIPILLINQLLSLRHAEYTGADPDKPEGLEAWIKL